MNISKKMINQQIYLDHGQILLPLTFLNAEQCKGSGKTSSMPVILSEVDFVCTKIIPETTTTIITRDMPILLEEFFL